MNFDDALRAGRTTTARALEIYDRLEPVTVEEMLGTWRGSEFPTGHPMDGLLLATGWYGKHFRDSESVHPLLFYSADRSRVFAVNPARLPMLSHYPKLPGPSYRWMILGLMPLLETRDYKARLRLTEYRGKTSATMIYNDKPINDVFRKVDDETRLGLMDLRGQDQPYFFVLRRDRAMSLP